MTTPPSPHRKGPGPVIPGSWAARVGATVTRFRDDCRGATVIEYGLIGALVFLVAASAIRLYADRVSGMYAYIGTKVMPSS